MVPKTVTVEPPKKLDKKSENQSKKVGTSEKPKKELQCASSKVSSKRKEGPWSLESPKKLAKKSQNKSKVVENLLEKSEKKLEILKFTTKSKTCLENLAKKSHKTVAVEPSKNLAKKSKNQCKLFETSEKPSEKKLQCESCRFATKSKALLENHIKKSHKTKKTDILLRVDYVKGVHPKVQESSKTSIDVPISTNCENIKIEPDIDLKTSIDHVPISTECENIKIEPDIDLDLFDVDMKDDFMLKQ